MFLKLKETTLRSKIKENRKCFFLTDQLYILSHISSSLDFSGSREKGYALSGPPKVVKTMGLSLISDIGEYLFLSRTPGTDFFALCQGKFDSNRGNE